MLRLITRHGQVARGTKFINGHLFPLGEVPLSDLGREQAKLLGERLKQEGFQGKILSSPFMRTMETANIVAGILGLKVIPFPPLREMFFNEESKNHFQGRTKEQLCELYENVDKECELEYPWWTSKVENIEELEQRVLDGVKLAEEMFPDEPILYIGHGASVHGLSRAYAIQKTVPDFLYNCALSYCDNSDVNFKKVHCNTDHIPYEKTTSNFLTREEFDREYFNAPYEKEIEIPNAIHQIKGTKILHIGDTHSLDYPYYKKLIQIIKPDIILHTGDMADEVKVGRMPEKRYEYLTKIEWFTNMLNESGARLIIVSGNNDLTDEIRKMLPTAEIYPINTSINIDGIACKIGHQVLQMTFDEEWSFYGHGLTGETWRYEQNPKTGAKRFNACNHSYVVCLTENAFYRIDKPLR